MSTTRALTLAGALVGFATATAAQTTPMAEPGAISGLEPGGAVGPVMDRERFAHVIFNEFEGRWNGTNTEFGWD